MVVQGGHRLCHLACDATPFPVSSCPLRLRLGNQCPLWPGRWGVLFPSGDVVSPASAFPIPQIVPKISSSTRCLESAWRRSCRWVRGRCGARSVLEFPHSDSSTALPFRGLRPTLFLSQAFSTFCSCSWPNLHFRQTLRPCCCCPHLLVGC